MKKQKHRFALHVSIGRAGACPDCGEPTPFHRASLLGECPKEPWAIDADLLRALASTLVGSQKSGSPVCRSCREQAQRFHWIEVAEGAVVGPFCSSCLRTQPHDAPVYVMSVSKKVLLAARVVTRFAPKPPPVVASDSQLF